MIYLIITTSINNRFGMQDSEERKQRYLYAITETLKNVPDGIKPIIVENNGKRETYLDNFYYFGKRVEVCYTDNNRQQFKSKGANELLDIKEVMKQYDIKDDDMLIKLTGRYRVTSPKFFQEVIDAQNQYDAVFKFYGIKTISGIRELKYDYFDCILGLYALRPLFLKLFNHLTIDNYKSAEVAFAKYVRFSAARIKELEELNVECSFADDLQIMNV